MTWNVVSLCSGIGGLDLGLERAGMTVVTQAEFDPYCSTILAKNWPTVPNLGDITLIDWSTHERPDVLCAGYPCQPFSLAGTREGEADHRHLWPHVADAIRSLRPRYAILENVPGHRSLGFDRVLGDLAEIGYDTEWDCIPALAVGAPHRRDRVWIVAYPQRDPVRTEPLGIFGRFTTAEPRHDGSNGLVGRPRERELDDMADAADAERCGRDGRPRHIAEADGRHESADGRLHPADADGSGLAEWRTRRPAHDRSAWPTEPGLGDADDGVPAGLARPAAWERGVPRTLGAVRMKNRNAMLKALGNAVVPQVAEHVGRLVMEADAR